MLKTFSKDQIRCRGYFYQEINAIGVEKIRQILSEIDKNPKKINFRKFHAVFVYFWKALVASNFKDVQQGTNWLS